MQTTSRTKTFKEVHEELERESMFVKKEHDITNFTNKANALEIIGLKNSIATKLYRAVSENLNKIKQCEIDYCGQYKFILEPQLERLCEKYNLFVRPLEYFLGDIPEKNVKDIVNFHPRQIDILPNNVIFPKNSYDKSRVDEIFNKHYMVCSPIKRINLEQAKLICRFMHTDYNFIENKFCIAATESMFSEEAFSKTKSRIVGYSELQPKSQVDLDPIILFKIDGGYIIITAWGDEANDELVVNERNN